MQISVRVPDEIVKAADEFIDKVKYRSRAQIVTVALLDWLVRNGVTKESITKESIDGKVYSETKNNRGI